MPYVKYLVMCIVINSYFIMKIVAAFVIYGFNCNYVEDLNFVSYFNRNSVRELMHELVMAAVKRLSDPRKIILSSPWQFVLMKKLSRVCVLVTDEEYPTTVSFEILHKLHTNPEILERLLENCQCPQTISPMYRIRAQLDETLVIMHDNIDKIIERGHDIDELVEKSENLSKTSKTFYRVAKKHNRCCVVQ